ncbi:ABC transporter substrate-binding protein [Azorhizobium oxalatiphilum]|uniref:ABC transporter substrate-binding protein n=1 Tax=Azorhizobium oxalatiphilum TaxID=980631 RepID=A0A917C8M1_9HYPH|nr:extracellular solute-binding protein [Azorhizobium oxalatiphilum]GGF76996.1 ABC transporter substrate-binding protein [Azorhizobium oxalatiphilum]
MHLKVRRLALAAAFLACATPALAQPAPGPFRFATSLMGEPKYKDGFKHFDYVNPEAPRGGTVRLSADGTFDSFNFIIPRGTSGAGLSQIYDTLTTQSRDEVATAYGLISDGLRFPEDYSSVTYRLNPNAKWHDGQPITPDDVVWSFEVLTKNNPGQAFYYRHVKGVAKTGDHEVTFTFDQGGNRELPQIVGELLILPKHWWTGTDANGKPRDITQGTLEPPLGSGAYKIKSFVPGRTIVYERVKDYWAKDLPVNVGRNNFDEIRYEYYRDDTVELEAFKADQYDFRVETSAKNWATAYDFPAKQQGKVKLELFENRSVGQMQAFIPNLRREKFQDARVRRALNYALDFEGMNHTLFFDQYKRTMSYFSGTELASSGLPTGAELDILNGVKDKVPPGVFTTPYTNPENPDEQSRRANLRQAADLLKQAGWQVKGRQLVNAKGEPFTLEILLAAPAFERVALFYKPALERLGIQVSVRLVDSSQYTNRVRARDFDMIITGWGQSLSPGNEQRDYWGSESADREGSRNYAGIKNPAVDALIEKVIYATDRTQLVAATHALDRVLLWNDYVIPSWTFGYSRTARWDRFAHPPVLPQYSYEFPDIWWWDAAKAAKIGGAQ